MIIENQDFIIDYENFIIEFSKRVSFYYRTAEDVIDFQQLLLFLIGYDQPDNGPQARPHSQWFST
ncbi:hypothetical protein AAEO50_05580 [Rossellomorea oryzaecorticis]|uniref:Uncharacterized protein n=1 Tax=Rossellomorea oryzaecorticis TaxID=1396505 RepID=A0ABU9K9Z8_9BACI